MSTQTIQMTPELYKYYQSVAYREPDALKALREATQQLTGAQMQISPEQGQFMAMLIELLQAKKTLDIGTFTGYSALAVALSLPQDGKVIACDISLESSRIAEQHWKAAKVAHKIEMHIAEAKVTLQKLLDEGQANTFDFAFIDADKNNYSVYYEQAIALVRSGGIVAIDNVLWGGKVADLNIHDHQTNAIRALNERVFQDARVTICMLPIGDGLTLVRKK